MSTVGKFALVQKNDKGGITARVTKDITLKQGQVVFFNDFEESLRGLATRNIISAEEVETKIARTRELDTQYGRETIYSLRAGNVPEDKDKL